jgi:diguanylate cyclase (GGDEF)-like protein
VLRRYDLLGSIEDGEFLLVLPQCDVDESASVAERLREVLSATPVSVGTESIRLTASYGVASTAQRPGARMGQLLGAASFALRGAQEKGRDELLVARSQDWRDSEASQATSTAPAA